MDGFVKYTDGMMQADMNTLLQSLRITKYFSIDLDTVVDDELCNKVSEYTIKRLTEVRTNVYAKLAEYPKEQEPDILLMYATREMILENANSIIDTYDSGEYTDETINQVSDSIRNAYDTAMGIVEDITKTVTDYEMYENTINYINKAIEYYKNKTHTKNAIMQFLSTLS